MSEFKILFKDGFTIVAFPDGYSTEWVAFHPERGGEVDASSFGETYEQQYPDEVWSAELDADIYEAIPQAPTVTAGELRARLSGDQIRALVDAGWLKKEAPDEGS